MPGRRIVSTVAVNADGELEITSTVIDVLHTRLVNLPVRVAAVSRAACMVAVATAGIGVAISGTGDGDLEPGVSWTQSA